MQNTDNDTGAQASPQAFTLNALRMHLEAGGYAVADSGADVAAYEAEAAAILGMVHTPRFFVTVHGRGDLLEFTTLLMSTVWSVFTRGQMEFNCRMVDGRPRGSIVQRDPEASS